MRQGRIRVADQLAKTLSDEAHRYVFTYTKE